MAKHTGKSMFVSSPIDVDTWNDAVWAGTAYFHDPSGKELPALGLVFRNEAAGRRIFIEWRSQFGKSDVSEYLRIAIIEGDVPGEGPGYFVHVGAEPDVVLVRAKVAGIEDTSKLLMSLVSRIHRMTPPPGSPNLPKFKEQYAKFGDYELVPVFIRGGRPEPAFDLAIRKKKIHFRAVTDVGTNDIDRVCFATTGATAGNT
jgi:hypothetical protein